MRSALYAGTGYTAEKAAIPATIDGLLGAIKTGGYQITIEFVEVSSATSATISSGVIYVTAIA